MRYLDRLKSEKRPPTPLPKLPEPSFGSFGSTPSRHFLKTHFSKVAKAEHGKVCPRHVDINKVEKEGDCDFGKLAPAVSGELERRPRSILDQLPPQGKLSQHATVAALLSTPSAVALACFKIGYPWLKEHLEELLSAGWTRRELFGRGRHKWPIGNWGAAWLSSWKDERKTPSIGPYGEIIFSFTASGYPAQQTAWPGHAWRVPKLDAPLVINEKF